MIGLRFLLKGGTFLTVAPPNKEEVRQIFSQWSNSLAAGPSIIRGVCRATGVEWMVSTAAIEVIHTIAVEQPQQAQQPGWLGPFISGGRN